MSVPMNHVSGVFPHGFFSQSFAATKLSLTFFRFCLSSFAFRFPGLRRARLTCYQPVHLKYTSLPDRDACSRV